MLSAKANVCMVISIQTIFFSQTLLFVALVALVALVANVAGVLIYVKLSKLVFLTMSKAQIRIPFLAISDLGN
jgi:hypothetical protein